MSSRPPSPPDPARGVFGLRVRGIDGGELLPAAGDPRWPELTVEQSLGVPEPRGEWHLGFGGRRACLPVAGGLLRIERATSCMTLRSERPIPEDELVHPWLTPGAALFARWHGREAFHGGAFVAGERAWALFAGKEGGKSTLLGWLAAHGHGVVSDDLLVIEGRQVFAGPRCVDLRPGTPEALGDAALALARGGSRRRLVLEPVPAALPLAGIVYLAWHSETEVASVPLAERIPRLRAQNGFDAAPAGESALLELAALPTLELRRPRSMSALADGASALLAAVHAAGRLTSS